jgi:hypothetical protein
VEFHVGITRILGDGFGGDGLARIHSLADDPAVRREVSECGADPGPGASLAVVISAGLFADLRAEGLADAPTWLRIAAADAWLRVYRATES